MYSNLEVLMKILLSALILVSFNSFAQSSQETRDRLSISLLAKATHAIARLDLSCNEASECSVIPMGSKPCGGPTSYIVTSVNHRYLSDIEELASKVSEKEKDFNQRYGRISNCSILYPPEVKCLENKCYSPSSNFGGSIMSP